MIDFHSHILPNMDDGASSMNMSLAMLRNSFLQGVDVVVATPHFYATDEYPKDFLQRRNHLFELLESAEFRTPTVFPQVILGAEVLYFPGISEAEDIQALTIGNSRSILIEPPMVPWTDSMLDEISNLGQNIGGTPIIAHVDRYMNMLRDHTLIDRVRERNFLVQVNAEYFINPATKKAAIKNLKKGKIQLVGSDCHNMDTRVPNLGLAWKEAKRCGAEQEFRQLSRNATALLTGEKQE